MAWLTGAGAALAQAQVPADPPGWHGELSLGGAIATGNTERRSFDLEARAAAKLGRLENKYRVSAGQAVERGMETERRLQADAQANIDLTARLYGLGLAQYDNNRFSTYRYELAGGLGLGYRLVATSRVKLAVETGPGYRTGRVRATGDTQSELFWRIASTLTVQISDTAQFADELQVTEDRIRTRVENTASLTTNVVGNIAARISFNVRRDSAPPAGVAKTDTLTKLSLVYSY